MIWCDPFETMDFDYYVHPHYHSDASYKPIWHAAQGAVGSDEEVEAGV